MSMTSGTQRNTHRRARLVDFSFYILIAIAFVAAIFIVEGRWGHEALIRWGGLVGYTAILFGYFINDSRQFFKNRSFWILTVALFFLHLGVFIAVLMHVTEWKLPWFMIVVFEVPVFILLRNQLPC